jgi:hypothetical protein
VLTRWCMRTYRHTDIHTYTHIQTYRHTDIQTYRHTHIQTYRHTDIQTYRHTDIQTYRHTDIQTYRHTDIQTYRGRAHHSKRAEKGAGSIRHHHRLVELNRSREEEHIPRCCCATLGILGILGDVVGAMCCAVAVERSEAFQKQILGMHRILLHLHCSTQL